MGVSYRTAQAKNRSRFYLLLSILFVAGLFKWGIPFLIDVIAGDGAVRQNVDSDVIPPQAPVLAALPEATNSALILVEGYTEPQATLEVLVNDESKSTDKAKDDGSFSILVQLSSSANRIQVRAKDAAENMSASNIETVDFDNKPLEITVTTPKDGTELFGKNSQVADIRGEVNKKNAQVIINNSFVVVDSEGSFSHRVQLQNGRNEFKVVASDKAGNTTESSFALIYTP